MASIVRLDSVKSVRSGHIYSLRATVDVENGQVGVAGNLLTGEREVRSFDKSTAVATDGAVLISDPEVVADESSRANNNLKNFTIKAGKDFKAYELAKDDIFSVSDDAIEAISTAVVVGNNVVLDPATYDLKEVLAAGAADHKFVGRIEEVNQIGTTTVVGDAGIIAGGVSNLVVIRVLAN
jgi:hypothetical protein